MHIRVLKSVVALAWLLMAAAAQPQPVATASMAFEDLLARHQRVMQPVADVFAENTVQIDYLEGDDHTGEHIVFNWQQGRYRKEFYWVGLTEVFGFDGYHQWHGSDYNLPQLVLNGDTADITSQLVGYFAYLTPQYARYLGPADGELPLDVSDRFVVMRFAPPEMSEALILLDPLDYRLAGMLLGNAHRFS